MTVRRASVVNKRRKKKPSLRLTLSAAILLIIGGLVAFWLFTQGRPLARDLPVGASIIPQDAVFSLSLTTDTQQWQKLQEFGTPETKTELDQNLWQLRDRFLTNYGYDFQKDIKPWVGETVTIAILAPAKTTPQPIAEGNTSSQQSVIMVLPIKKPDILKNVIAQTKASKQNKWTERTYQDITIQQGEKLSAALLGEKFLVIADSDQTTERAIDAYKNKLNLANSVGFAGNFPKIANYQPFAQFYINVPIAAKIAATAPNRRLPAQVLTQLQNNQGLAGTLSLESQGISLKGISWLNTQSKRVLAVENRAGNIQNRIPGETLMMLSVSNLQRVWSEYVSTSNNNPLSPFAPQDFRKQVKTLTTLDLEQDLLSWMQKEFAICIIPNSPQAGTSENFRAGLVVMVQASDRQKAENALQKLDEAMRNQFQLQTQTATIANKPVINWVAPYGTVTATHGWLDGDVVFFVLGGPVTDQLIPQPNQTLANTQLFQQTVPTELNPANTQFFLDVEKIAQHFNLSSLFPNQKNLISTTQTIGLTTAINDNRSIRYDVLLKLKKAINS